MSNFRPFCTHCPNRERCSRLGCYAFNARARIIADHEDRVEKSTKQKLADDLARAAGMEG